MRSNTIAHPAAAAASLQQQGSATLECVLAVSLGIVAMSGVLLVSWLLTVKSVMQSLASETASIIAHQQITIVTTTSKNTNKRTSPAFNRLHYSLREQIRTVLNSMPLVPLFTRNGLGIRLHVKPNEVLGQDTVVSIYLCLPPFAKFAERTIAPDGHRDCLGQFSQKESYARGTWLFVQSSHPPLASAEIYSDGLRNLPNDTERAEAVRLLQGIGSDWQN
jgi:hypothetical protein